MDSMRSLNTSLPRSSPHSSVRQPPSELLSAFKAAALSVTQLYKTAASDHDATRAAGYQDAIEELLNFLDQENLGLGDGEGWSVRQWATERLSPFSHGDEIEADADGDGTGDSASSPTAKLSDASEASVPPQSESEANQPVEPVPQQDSSSTNRPQDSNIPQHEVFHFRSNTALPSANDADMANTDHRSTRHGSPSASRFDMAPRSSRAFGPRNPKLGNGPKRKSVFSDFFDIPDFGNGRDSFNGSKRNRLS